MYWTNVPGLKKTPSWGLLCIFLLFFLFISGCTTQDFEYAGKVKATYRLKLTNLSPVPVKHKQDVFLYYLDGKDTVNAPQATLASGDSTIIATSQKGTYGVKIGIKFKPKNAIMNLKLEKGTGTGKNFTPDTVVVSKSRRKVIVIRYGEHY